MIALAHPLKRGIKRTLNVIGYDVVATQPPQSQPEWPVDGNEIERLQTDLESFALEHTDRGPWSNPLRAREYLSDKRLVFYQEVLRMCRDHDINFENRRVADVGSGTGYLLRRIHEVAPSANLTGYDVYDDIIALAAHLCPTAAFIHRDLFDLRTERHDIVFATEVLEHLIEPHRALETMLHITEPGGRLILTVPNGRTDSMPASGLRPDGRGYWGHIHFWSPESWPLFIARNVCGRTFECSTLATGENYAVIST